MKERFDSRTWGSRGALSSEHHTASWKEKNRVSGGMAPSQIQSPSSTDGGTQAQRGACSRAQESCPPPSALSRASLPSEERSQGHPQDCSSAHPGLHSPWEHTGVGVTLEEALVDTRGVLRPHCWRDVSVRTLGFSRRFRNSLFSH